MSQSTQIAPASKEPRPGFARRRFDATRLLQDQGLVIVMVIFGGILSLLSPTFLTTTNLLNLLLQASALGVMALGMMFVIIGAGIDLSVGGIPALVSVLAIGLAVRSELPIWFALLVAVFVGVAVGAANGFVITKLGIAPLIATLGTLSITIGLAFAYSGGTSIVPVPDFYNLLRRANVFGIPINIIILLVLAVITHLVLTRTTFGRSLYAVGGNRQAADMAGIRTTRIIFFTYVISAVAAAIAGILFTARLASGSPQMGLGIELTVIAAVVIGGTSLFGGRGNVLGTVVGAVLITMVTNAINLLGVPTAWDRVLLGVVIVIAALLDVLRLNFHERWMSRKTS
ncbi:ABC transporter permease [Ornithinimicrobium cryptoxanthini]|uniref:ABC transporter permease n=1 Tax=Ornithinimicrobium cryptoxanthini TaxID=2934161 RepID=A0ABY4YEY3_9MICO|nr:ABC transporter permease [Ornithinimicrobium cryptoxanthini]USQ75340.1 ABC transporter permease [Ornithinimicrobium cryptoxanthini]